MIKNFVFLFSLFWSSFALGQTLTSRYANLFAGGRALLVVRPTSVTLIDLEFPAQRCKKNDKFECVKSQSFVFSIPRDIVSRNTWNHLGAKYKVSFRQEIVMRGELIEYLLIRQTMSKSKVDFLYSGKLGVIALKAVGGQELNLLEECGFAAIAARSQPHINCVVP
jgi:hypothetical protein